MKRAQKNITERTQAVWGTKPAGHTHASQETPGTKQYFEQVLKGRFTHEHYWLAEFVDYSAWKHKKVLEIGCGAGYDAFMFANNGAQYTGIDLTPQNIVLTQKHLDYYNLSASIIQMDATQLTLQEKFDLVYSFGVLHHIPDIELALQNIHQVLADDGQFYCVVYNKNSVFYWGNLFLTWIMSGGFFRENFKTRLARIEFTMSNELPHVDVYSKLQLKKIFKKAGFEITDLSVHQLNREDFPSFFKLKYLWGRIPQSWLIRAGRYVGWYVCIKAKKSIV